MPVISLAGAGVGLMDFSNGERLWESWSGGVTALV